MKQYNKQYNPPIAFDVDQPVSGVRRYTVFARNEQEAIDKVKNNNLTEHDSQWFEELDSIPNDDVWWDELRQTSTD